jgi:hypothetical protein
MPLHSYKCINGHETERLYLSISVEPEHYTPCETCELTATLVEFPRTGPPRLIGDGFHSPSKAGPMINKPDSSKAWAELRQRKLVNDHK